MCSTARLGEVTDYFLRYMMPSESNNEYEHGLRRSMVSGVAFTWLHWPLCATLVLASAASGRMVAENEVSRGVVWYWGCGLGFALLLMVLVDMTHKNLAPTSESRIPRVGFTTSVAFTFMNCISQSGMLMDNSPSAILLE